MTDLEKAELLGYAFRNIYIQNSYKLNLCDPESKINSYEKAVLLLDHLPQEVSVQDIFKILFDKLSYKTVVDIPFEKVFDYIKYFNAKKYKSEIFRHTKCTLEQFISVIDKLSPEEIKNLRVANPDLKKDDSAKLLVEINNKKIDRRVKFNDNSITKYKNYTIGEIKEHINAFNWKNILLKVTDGAMYTINEEPLEFMIKNNIRVPAYGCTELFRTIIPPGVSITDFADCSLKQLLTGSYYDDRGLSPLYKNYPDFWFSNVIFDKNFDKDVFKLIEELIFNYDESRLVWKFNFKEFTEEERINYRKEIINNHMPEMCLCYFEKKERLEILNNLFTKYFS